ncbi:uncharacterized protein VTP21DRAFT_10889 [Calcarisporiella thermophila]|uniref:uncharacterized protein n=1 Tax=Calcarisporiella thermophila TaxID=911321 RepID=UPI0037424621
MRQQSSSNAPLTSEAAMRSPRPRPRSCSDASTLRSNPESCSTASSERRASSFWRSLLEPNTFTETSPSTHPAVVPVPLTTEEAAKTTAGARKSGEYPREKPDESATCRRDECESSQVNPSSSHSPNLEFFSRTPTPSAQSNDTQELPPECLTKVQSRFQRQFPELAHEVAFVRRGYTCSFKRGPSFWQGVLLCTNNHVCFYGRLLSKAMRVVVHLRDVAGIERDYRLRVIPNALRIVTAEKTYTFNNFLSRDAAYEEIVKAWELAPYASDERPGAEFVSGETLASLPDSPGGPQHGYERPEDTRSNPSIDKPAPLLSEKGAALGEGELDVSMLAPGEVPASRSPGTPVVLPEKLPGHPPALELCEPPPPPPDIHHPSGAGATGHHSASELSATSTSSTSTSKEAQECPCESHLKFEIMDLVVSLSYSAVEDMLFGGSETLHHIHQGLGTSDLHVGPWRRPRDAGAIQERELTYRANFRIFRHKAMTQCYETQALVHASRHARVYASASRAPHVPFGDLFAILYRCCILRVGSHLSRVRVTAQVEFKKGMLFEGIVERTVVEGITGFFQEVTRVLKTAEASRKKHLPAELDRRVGRGGAKRPPRKSRKKKEDAAASSLAPMEPRGAEMEGPAEKASAMGGYDRHGVLASFFHGFHSFIRLVTALFIGLVSMLRVAANRDLHEGRNASLKRASVFVLVLGAIIAGLNAWRLYELERQLASGRPTCGKGRLHPPPTPQPPPQPLPKIPALDLAYEGRYTGYAVEPLRARAARIKDELRKIERMLLELESL